MIAGAARELKLGDPRDPATHVGPVIDAEAKERLDRWIAGSARQGRVRYRWDEDRDAARARHLSSPPTIVELDRARDLTRRGVRPDPARRALARATNSTRCSTRSPATATA